MPRTRYPLEVNPEIPPRFARLEELANDLWYSWNRLARGQFAQELPSTPPLQAYASAAARQLAEWKTLVRSPWSRVYLRHLNHVATHVRYSKALRFEFATQLNGSDAVAVNPL